MGGQLQFVWQLYKEKWTKHSNLAGVDTIKSIKNVNKS